MNNKIKEAFDTVHAENSLKQQTKSYLNAKMKGGRTVHIREFVTAFACLVLVLFAFGAYRFYTTPVSAISIDVNPSVELGINHFDKVVSVNGYNEDGNALAASVNLQNMNYYDALDVLLNGKEMQPYLDNDGLVYITVVGSNDKKSEEMRLRILSCEYAAQSNVICQCGNRAAATAAHEAGLSLGKYQAFLELQELNPNVTVDDVRGLSMRQIWNMIDELSDTQGDTSQNNNTGENGNGSGNGDHPYHGGR